MTTRTSPAASAAGAAGAATPAATSRPALLSRRRTDRDRWPRLGTGLIRPVAVLGLAGGLALSGASTASAHVHVEADGTASGSYSALTFRVPNESAKASTTKVQVLLPQQDPFTYVGSKPIPGWTVKTATAPLPKPIESDGATLTKAVRTVTWTADDKASRIGPGQYQEFSISVGPLPDEGKTVTVPAVQTYSDGKVVTWNQPTPAGGEEPDYPAPTFVVTAPESEGEPTAPEPSESSEPSASASASGTASSSQPAAAPSASQVPPVAPAELPARADATARGLGAAGLVLGLAALVTAVLAYRRRRGADGRP